MPKKVVAEGDLVDNLPSAGATISGLIRPSSVQPLELEVYIMSGPSTLEPSP